ncbi:MAG: aquaporin [Candidatus Nitrosothermus koennekii]|nr:MAG: aquaporin [Candidatus Nitrosothermus koennekii]
MINCNGLIRIRLLSKLLAEFIGTFLLVIASITPVVIDAKYAIGIFPIAFSPGIVVSILIYIFSKISGAHFNPAVSLAFLLEKRINFREFIYYVIVQFLASIPASLLVYHLIGDEGELGSTLPNRELGIAFGFEVLLTVILISIILVVVRANGLKNLGGIIIGLTIAMNIIIGSDISGASMNPARSFGPMIISNNIEYLWIYLSAPFIGSILAVYLFKLKD